MVFICVILWNNYVVGIGEITDDSSTCQRVAEVPWETPGGRVQRRREGGGSDVGRCTIKLCT